MSVARRYTERALRLIQYGNGESEKVRKELGKLAILLRREVLRADLPAMKKREIDRLIMDIKLKISGAYDVIANQQLASVTGLVAVEASWAQMASQFTEAPPARLLGEIPGEVRVFGETIKDAWEAQGESLRRRVTGMAMEVAAGKMLADAAAPLLSSAMNTAARNADALVHTTVTQAAADARMPVWRKNGVNAFKFHAVLDSRTTMECAMRHGLLYDLDTLAPIGHNVVLDHAPPRHYRCRSIMLPMAYGPDIQMPEDGGQSTFREYFDSLSREEQDSLFGPRRAELFRAGAITQADLIGQAGRAVKLADLDLLAAERLTPETQVALWWRKPRGELQIGGVPIKVEEMIGAKKGGMVHLSHYTRKKQLSHHPELTVNDYTKLPRILAEPTEFFADAKPRHAILVSRLDETWLAVLKSDGKGKMYLQSFRKTSQHALDKLKERSKKKGSR